MTNGADTAVSPDTIEKAFRLAGFQFGTPDSNDRKEYQPPDDYDVVIQIFDRVTVVDIANSLPNDLALPYNLAAAMLEHITLAGYTVTGRQIELESYSVGDITYTYPVASVYRRSIQRVINALRSQGRQLLAEVIAAGENPSPISPNVSDRIPLTASEVAFIVSEHANLNTAHHTPPSVPDVSDFVPSVDIDNRISTAIANAGTGSGISSSAVDTKIASHASDDDAHHVKPDVSGFVGSSEVATAIRNHAGDDDAHHSPPDISGLASSSEVATAIQNHKTDIDAHHTIPDTSQFLSSTAIDSKIATALATGSGLNASGVQALIDTHKSVSDAHHTIPDVSQFMTKAQVDTEIANAGTGTGITGIQVDTKIATHASDSDAHHAIPDISAFLSGTEINEKIDAFTWSRHGIDQRIATAVANHAALPNVHHIPPTPSSGGGGGNPTMYRQFKSLAEAGFGFTVGTNLGYKTWFHAIPGDKLPETENNTTTSPRHYRVSLRGGLFWPYREVTGGYIAGCRIRLRVYSGSANLAIVEASEDLPDNTKWINSRDDETDRSYSLNIDTIIQSNVNTGRYSFALEYYIQEATLTVNSNWRQGGNADFRSVKEGLQPVEIDALHPLLFRIERLDNLATSL